MSAPSRETSVYARVIIFDKAKCRTCGSDLISGAEARLELVLESEGTGLPCRDRGLICVRCFGQIGPRGEQIPEILTR